VIQQPAFINQQARGYGLGGTHEIPFSLARGAPSLPPDDPGSAALRGRRPHFGQPARALADAPVRPQRLTVLASRED